MGSKIQEKKTKKRKDIINAAIKLFSEKGFHGTKTSEIAKEANIAEGTVYLYFRNKDALLMIAFKEEIDKLLDNLREKNKTLNSTISKIIGFIDYHIELLKINPTLIKFLVVELRQSSDFINKYPEFRPLKEYFGFLDNLISEAITNNEIREIDKTVLSAMIFGTMDILLTRSLLLQNEEEDLKKQLWSAEDILLKGLLTDNA